jgi:hypothetical protein
MQSEFCRNVEETQNDRTMGILILLAVSLVTAASALSQSLDGLWRSQGYGYVFELRGSHLKAFEVTSMTCVLGFTARLQPITIAGGDSGSAATFVSNDGRRFFIRTGNSQGHRSMHFEDSTSDIQIERMKRLPVDI